MKFSAEEIEIARAIRDKLDWVPRAGHYVYDETEFCKQASPFQDRVYFILNYDYFMKTVGGVDRFQEIMTWLPTWYDCREILESQNRTPAEIADQLQSLDAMANGTERLALYQMIASHLK
jgi:hypothetical protein